MPRDIGATAATALDAALRIIEAEYPDDLETRQACAKLVAERLRSQTFIRSDAEQEKSRPKW